MTIIGIPKRVVETKGFFMYRTPPSWLETLDIQNYMVTQSTFCLYLYRVLDVLERDPLMRMQGSPTLGINGLRAVHQEQRRMLQEYVGEPLEENRHSFYYESLAQALGANLDPPCGEGLDIKVLMILAVGYWRGYERYLLLRQQPIGQDIWMQFTKDAKQNHNNVMRWFYKNCDPLELTSLLARTMETETCVMQAIEEHHKLRGSCPTR